MGTKQLLIRAVGPALASYGVICTLVDPQLGVYDGGTVIASNNDWSSTLSSTFTTLGAFALNTGSKDAALLVTLQVGKADTVQVSWMGHNRRGTGRGLRRAKASRRIVHNRNTNFSCLSLSNPHSRKGSRPDSLKSFSIATLLMDFRPRGRCRFWRYPLTHDRHSLNCLVGPAGEDTRWGLDSHETMNPDNARPLQPRLGLPRQAARTPWAQARVAG